MNHTINLKRDLPRLVRKPNRPDPAPVIAPSPPLRDELPDLAILTDAERERLYEASFREPGLYRLTWELAWQLGITQQLLVEDEVTL